MKNDWLSWFEIPAIDIARARKFYETIFEVELEFMDLGVLKMAVFPHGNIGGAVVQHPEFYLPSDKGILAYLNADPDLDVVLARVKAAGGEVLISKRQISPEHGYMAVFLDTEGNRLALHSNA